MIEAIPVIGFATIPNIRWYALRRAALCSGRIEPLRRLPRRLFFTALSRHVVSVQQQPFAVVGVGRKVPVRRVNHRQRCSHPPREGKQVDAGGERPRRVCVAEVVDPSMGNAAGAKPRGPLAVTELLEVDVAASRGGEQERRIKPRRENTARDVVPVRLSGAERAQIVPLGGGSRRFRGSFGRRLCRRRR